MRIVAPLLFLPLAALCPATGATGQAPAQAPPAAAQANAGQGLTVVRDADTGRLRAPTPAEMQALQRRAPGALAAPPRPGMITGRDGRRQVQLGERSLVYSVVTRTPNGKLDQHCVDGADAAERALAQSAKGADQQEARHDHR